MKHNMTYDLTIPQGVGANTFYVIYGAILTKFLASG